MFQNTRLKLTSWYLIIIMFISMLFSMIIFSMVNSEFTRIERMQIRIQEEIQYDSITSQRQHPPRFTRIDPEEIKEARIRLITTLGIINLIILGLAGTAGYFLAGRTLKPIKEMIDEQNRFVSDSSHELRTPLTTLRTELEVALRNKNLTANESKKVLESNLEEVLGLQMLSDNLLELSQNGSSLKNSNVENISTKLIVQSAVKKTEILSKSKQIKIKIKVKDLQVKGIEDRLVEVFIILIDNATKYSSKKSTIEIVSKELKGKVQILVIDHGMGISNEDLPHIFDRFYRSDKSRSENGYGLGLSIARKIINSHNGSISAKSENKTTTFIVTLPTS